MQICCDKQETCLYFMKGIDVQKPSHQVKTTKKKKNEDRNPFMSGNKTYPPGQ